MLAELAVSGLGVIDHLSLVFGAGLTALTGETGAGKTMVVGAIEMLSGGRTDGATVAPGASEATVEGRFVDGDDEVVLARVVPREGRSRAYVNGRLATAAALAERSAGLFDLHAQHGHVALLTTATQRRALDRFGHVDLGRLQGARSARREAAATLARLGGDAATRTREIDFLRYQLAELDAADLTDPDEDDRLSALEAVLADADAHREAASAAAAAIGPEGGAGDLVGAALGELAARSPFAEVAARLDGVASEIADLSVELRRLADAIDSDPQRLVAIQARRQRLTELRRRYTAGQERARGGRPGAIGSLGDLLAARDEIRSRLAELESHDERAMRAEGERAEAEEAERLAAAEVGTARRRAAGALASAVEARLRELALGNARFEVEVGGDDPGDDVTFLLAANPGHPLAPLAKAASGGELARTMLAVRLVLTESAPTLVFDEVDAGVGGAAARAVGRALAALAADRQVVVVTHLPQVAAFADTQVALVKTESGASTVVSAVALGETERVRELSRMLSGLPGSDTGRDHAEELLATAARERGLAPPPHGTCGSAHR